MRGLLHLTVAALALLPMAGCTTPQLTTALTDAQEVCTLNAASGGGLVALANVNGVPISTTGKTAAAIAADCALIDALPAPAGSTSATTVTLNK